MQPDTHLRSQFPPELVILCALLRREGATACGSPLVVRDATRHAGRHRRGADAALGRRLTRRQCQQAGERVRELQQPAINEEGSSCSTQSVILP